MLCGFVLKTEAFGEGLSAVVRLYRGWWTTLLPCRFIYTGVNMITANIALIRHLVSTSELGNENCLSFTKTLSIVSKAKLRPVLEAIGRKTKASQPK